MMFTAILLIKHPSWKSYCCIDSRQFWPSLMMMMMLHPLQTSGASQVLLHQIQHNLMRSVEADDFTVVMGLARQ